MTVIRIRLKIFTILFAFILIAGCQQLHESSTWQKGNLHTHTLWSDGDAPPETVIHWYIQHNYQFLALSDHNILSEGEKWITIYNYSDPNIWPPRFTKGNLEKLKEEFGENWPTLRQKGDTLQMKLKTLKELKEKFEVPGKFILIQSEEISDAYQGFPVHVNATNIKTVIPPQGGHSAYDVMQRNIDAVIRQRIETHQPMLPHINHPNFGWGIVAEDLIRLKGDSFFEVYNGHPSVKNWGDLGHPGSDRIWDIVLANRLHKGMTSLYGIATDDAHSYYQYRVGNANAGRGWVLVNSDSLTAASIVNALRKGGFYASSGVTIDNISYTDDQLIISIHPEQDVIYTTQFIGTPMNYDTTSVPNKNNGEMHSLHISRIYSDDIGQVLYESRENPAIYHFQKDELYIRAKVISSRKHPNPYAEGDFEMAWTQPIVPY